MKKIICLLLVLLLCFSMFGCDGEPVDTSDALITHKTVDDDTVADEWEAVQKADKILVRVVPFDTVKYELSELVSGRDHKVTKKEQPLDGTEVKLDVGTNVFSVVSRVSGIERTTSVLIARREGYRVVFNTNGGSFVDTIYVGARW